MLTKAELKVLSLMAEGYNNKSIAQLLCLSPKTIEHHISNIFSKVFETSKGQDKRVSVVLWYLKNEK